MTSLLRFALFAALSCNLACATTGTKGERAAQATGTMAVGGGFVAMGTVQVVGAGALAGIGATSELDAIGDTFLATAAVAGALAAVEIVVGLLLLQRGGEQLANAMDASPVSKSRPPRPETEADAEEMQERLRERRDAKDCTPGWDCPVEGNN